MYYIFSYCYNDIYYKHTCTTVKEAEFYFDLLIRLKVDYINIHTRLKESVKII